MGINFFSKSKFSELLVIVFIFSSLFFPLQYLLAQEEAGTATGEATASNPPPSPASQSVASSDCGWYDLSCRVSFDLGDIAAAGFAKLTYWVGVVPTNALIMPAAFIFDSAVYESLNGANYPIGNDNGIYAGWRVFRDIVNMIFIFIVIYIGLRTIMQIGGRGERQLLIYVIIIALLINFSLVITGIIIDASNILALGLYDQLETGTRGSIGPDAKTLAGVFLQAAQVTGAQSRDIFNATANAPSQSSSPGFWKSSLGNTGAIIINVVVIFVMLAAAVFFLFRIPILWILMVLSPLAFAAYILGGTRKYFNTWLSKLLNQAFFAPIFMAFFFAVAAIYNSPAFTNIGNVAGQSITAFILKYFMVVTLLVACLIVSKILGAYGAQTAISRGKGYAKQAGSFAGRHTIGRSASAIRNSNRMKRWVSRNPRLGSIALRPLEGIEKARFGGKKGDSYKERLDAGVKRRIELANYVSKDEGGNDLTVKKTRYYDDRIDEDTGGPVSVEETVSARGSYIEELSKQRGRYTTLSGIFKKGTPLKEVPYSLKGKVDDKGKPIKDTSATIGGRQTRADREALLKIFKEQNKGAKEKLEDLVEEIKKEAKDEGVEEGKESAGK